MGLFGWIKAAFSLRKLNADPRQHQLAQMLLGVLENRGSVEGVLEFLKQHGWSPYEQDRRLAHATSMIRVWRSDLYPMALELCKFLYLRPD
jgi:hypothetical protein